MLRPIRRECIFLVQYFRDQDPEMIDAQALFVMSFMGLLHINLSKIIAARELCAALILLCSDILDYEVHDVTESSRVKSGLT